MSSLVEEQRPEVFENHILRLRSKILENREWRKLHIRDLHGLCRSLNAVSVNLSRLKFSVLTGRPTGKDVEKVIGVDGRTIL